MERNVTSKRFLLASMAAAVIGVPAMVLTTQAQSRTTSDSAMPAQEKCYGIAKAGKNDCASTGNNSCAGTAKVDGDKKAWLYVAEGYCERIVGGSKTAT